MPYQPLSVGADDSEHQERCRQFGSHNDHVDERIAGPHEFGDGGYLRRR